MIDIKLIRESPELVKENIKKKYQEDKIKLVDDFLTADKNFREVKVKADNLRKERNEASNKVGELIRDGQEVEANNLRKEMSELKNKIINYEVEEEKFGTQRTVIWKQIPNIIEDTVPLGKDDTENVQLETFGNIKEHGYEIPYHTDILEKLDGIDLEAARKVSGNGFYYLMGDIARLHSAVLNYAKDFMINKGFTYCIPPFMIRNYAVEGVMSQVEKDDMMYKIEGEDLYLIGTSEHSMIARFLDRNFNVTELPQTLTSYSPCFRKEVGAHGIEERGLFRVHQFEKQEMIVICKPEESKEWFQKMLSYTVEIFKTLDIPVRTLECCSGDLADLKSKSVDVETWSPRQKKYFEIGSCSNLTDAQSRRLNIKMELDSKGNIHPHTLNNTVLTPPRMLIPFVENNYNEDGSVNIPEVLRPYMGGMEKIEVKNKK